MQTETVAIESLILDPSNARVHGKRNLDSVKASLLRWHQYQPLVVTDDNVVIIGNGRLEAMRQLGWTECEIIRTQHTGAEAAMMAIMDNRTAELAEWDDDTLARTLQALQADDEIDHLLSGFDDDEIGDLIAGLDSGDGDGESGGDGAVPEGAALVPWTSVLDARQGYWQDRKKKWRESGIISENGRDSNPFVGSGCGLDLTSKKIQDLRGTAYIFDPVLCEILYGWFCPQHGRVLDPFAGGSVRGIVAAEMGLEYTGMDLSQRQIDANLAQVVDRDMPGSIQWMHGDSAVDLPEGAFDFVMTCPPYYDLEVYSDGDGDISAMDWDGFLAAYRTIIAECAARLKPDRFAAIVIGEVRDKKTKNGGLRGLVPETIRACEDAGLEFYNDAILITPMGTVQMACINPFKKTRKLGRTHQYVLIFCNGDVRKATAACGGADVPMLEMDTDDAG